MFFDTVSLNEESDALVILDQTLLPHETLYRQLTQPFEIWEAIKSLQVRGAPAIGVAAAMGLYVIMKQSRAEDSHHFFAELQKMKAYLASARPTAVNLNWALDYMEQSALANQTKPLEEVLKILRETAQKLKDDDISVCRKIGQNGLSLLKPGMGILTHCNAGALATAGYGTALAPIYAAQEKNISVKVFADETRPLLQGARLTAYELHRAGVDVTLICDNMASIVMQKGWVDAVFVGCDRVAANGDTANKIGTSGVAILAAAYDIPFYVCAPFSTLDLSCPTGAAIVIEERDSREITEQWYAQPMAPSGISVFNPAFDVTEARYITAFVTEYGIIRPPYGNWPS